MTRAVMAMRHMEWFWALLVLLTAIRLVMAAVMPLTPDEAYYWIWSRHLQGGYLDHPFMVALWIRVGTFLVGDTSFGVRLLGPLSALAGSWLLVRAAEILAISRGSVGEGRRAALLLNATLMLGLGAATMTPDTPLLFFVTVMLFALSKALTDTRRQPALCWWMATGAALGLACGAKYTAILVGAGLAGYVLSSGRRLWREPGPWAAIPVMMICMAPVLYWNANHHWASFLKQGGRTADWHPARAFQFLGELLGGQVGLATPVIFVLFLWGTWRALRTSKLLAWMVLVPCAVFLVHATGDRVQANWPAVIYPVLAIAAAQAFRRIGWAVGTGLFLTMLVTIQAIFSPLPLSAHQDPILRQTAGWPDFGRALATQARAAGADALVVDDYALASILSFSQHDLPVIGTDRRWGFFTLPETGYRQAWTVQELRHGAPSGQRVCRLARQKIVRCYAVTLVQNMRGVELPERK